MTKAAEAVLADALSLSEEERAEIAAQLLASLPNAANPDWEAEWAPEIKRRMDAIDSGTVKAEPWEIVMERIRADLRQR